MMEEAEIVELLEKNIPDGLLSVVTPRVRKVSAEIAPDIIRKAAETLLGKGARLIIIAAVDAGLDIDLLYHFDLEGKVVVLRVKLGKEKPEIDTVADLTPTAEWAENEAAELCGVRFRDHPNRDIWSYRTNCRRALFHWASPSNPNSLTKSARLQKLLLPSGPPRLYPP